MKILVLVKEVPVVSAIRIDRATMTIDRSTAGKMTNPADTHAIEAALTVAGEKGGDVTAISMGPDSCEEVLRGAIALGAKEAIRVTDPAFAGADTLVTANVLKAVIDKTGPYDAIFCGANTIDGVTGQVGAKLASLLGFGILSCACDISCTEDGLCIRRKAGDGYEQLSASFPLVCTVTEDANAPRSVGLKGRSASKKAVIPVMTNAELGLDEAALTSLSKVASLVPPAELEKGQVLEGTDDADKADKLVQILLDKHLV
jgi:electron transfer flavoprotein beta subunit